jgi:hypothetical protein
MTTKIQRYLPHTFLCFCSGCSYTILLGYKRFGICEHLTLHFARDRSERQRKMRFMTLEGFQEVLDLFGILQWPN